jgi:ribosomal protein S18 acetylase RimI-like enzyme
MDAAEAEMTGSKESVRLAAVEPSQWPALRELATTIWRECYAAIITPAQIDFMLAERFSDDALARLTADAEHQLAVLWLGKRAVGYCGSGPGGEPAAQKLGQLYLLAEMRGRGLGRLMLAEVEQRARSRGAERLVLQVNKQNAAAIAFYQRQSFTIREAAVFDIGNGFVMDDYVMQKPLGRSQLAE